LAYTNISLISITIHLRDTAFGQEIFFIHSNSKDWILLLFYVSPIDVRYDTPLEFLFNALDVQCTGFTSQKAFTTLYGMQVARDYHDQIQRKKDETLRCGLIFDEHLHFSITLYYYYDESLERLLAEKFTCQSGK